MKSGIKAKAVEYILIMIGTTLMAVALNVFYQPNNLVTGGVTGFSIILNHLSTNMFGISIPMWLTNTVLNIPLFLIGMRVYSRDALWKTLFATFFLSFALIYTQFITPVADDMVLAAVFGGTISGMGLGLVFKCMATTGGVDLLASIIQKKLKHMTVAKIMLAIDAFIIAMGFFVFGYMTAMYSVIAVYIASKVIDSFLEGLSFAKAAFIISEKSDEIAKEIFENMGRGVTALSGKGMYTGNAKNVLLCVVSKKQIVNLKELSFNIDRNAFVIVTDVREVLGEGFGSLV